LVGGTALALQLGHRISVDLDLFAYEVSLPEQFQILLTNSGIKVENVMLSTRIQIFNLNQTKTDFVNYCYKWISEPIKEDGILMASPEDIAAMKLSAITNRGTVKDFVDLYFLLDLFDLQQMLSFYKMKYPEAAEFLVLKSLIYFDDAETDPLPKMLMKTNWENIKARIMNAVQKLSK
jgi:predicted nucleotidyltransferase component of viral defense system